MSKLHNHPASVQLFIDNFLTRFGMNRKELEKYFVHNSEYHENFDLPKLLEKKYDYIVDCRATHNLGDSQMDLIKELTKYVNKRYLYVGRTLAFDMDSFLVVD